MGPDYVGHVDVQRLDAAVGAARLTGWKLLAVIRRELEIGLVVEVAD
jgi:hypothetical protein